MDQKYIIGGGVLFIVLILLTVLITLITHKRNNNDKKDNKLNIQADSNIKLDVNNSIALRNSNMAQIALRKMLSGKQQYNPYGIDDKDKLY